MDVALWQECSQDVSFTLLSDCRISDVKDVFCQQKDQEDVSNYTRGAEK